MLNLPVYDRTGSKVGSIEIDPNDFGGKVNRQLLHDVVVMYQANLRQGTVKTKSRADVAGSGKKMYRQKGTGNARMGMKRTGKRVGGGHTHSKKPRDFGFTMPKKMIQTATRMALLSKLMDDETTVLQDLAVAEPKTKTVAALLSALNLAGQSCLIAPAKHDRMLYLSARNIDRVKVSPVADLNALDLLARKRLVITREALDSLREKRRGPEKQTT
jgi:large subunit ribosomal protein L4